ncbi:MAG TPA: carboxypeptidase regulatory-like domain-containing protein, partial [Candidatus Acidoferrum sp.]|nr:carboxypeptidase regulatory-like domain-containing protein [Candidatus Acidoferrum sp.]
MQRRQAVCVRTAWRSLSAGLLLCWLVLGCAATVSAQVNTATLSGTVVDPQGLGVKGAKVTVTNAGTGATRSSVTDDGGRYTLVGLPPGHYKMTVDSGASFGAYENASVVLTVGESATLDPHLELKSVTQTLTVSAETAPIETTKTEVSQTIEQRLIDNLPINGRNYINFTLTNSQTTRDVSPTIGPAPNSGLSIGGARARGTMVSVDGADAVDNSINGIRSTISQEGVQEFQLILSNYNAEYGRATGGVVNIVTKSGGNEFHGDAFGYFRNKAFQARNAFSGEVNPTTGALEPVKQAYTRTQSGLTFGGALKKDKTFGFFSYEYTQREESAFSSIGTGNFGLTTGLIPCIPIPLSMTGGASGQLAFYQASLGALTGNGALCNNPNPAIQAQIKGLEQAASLTGAATNVGLNADMNKNADGSTVPISSALFGIPAALGSKFFPIPVACPLGQQVNSVVCVPAAGNPPGVGTGLVPLPTSYVGLNSTRGNYPSIEKTSLWSARLDQRWNNRNNSFLRVGVSPSLVTGLPSTSQNQVFGQNAGTRAGYNQSRDLNVTFQHDTIVSDKTFNEFRAQIARRGLHFGFSQLPGGSNIGVNIPGFAYFGREPYSTVDRIERRFEFTDHVSLVRGNHTFKIGGDYNLIQLRSKKAQIFELDFGGDVNFGGLALFGSSIPGTSGLQSYGLGIPQSYIQG